MSEKTNLFQKSLNKNKKPFFSFLPILSFFPKRKKHKIDLNFFKRLLKIN